MSRFAYLALLFAAKAFAAPPAPLPSPSPSGPRFPGDPVSHIVIVPYGKLTELLDKDSPWRVFRADDPLLLSVHADRWSKMDCESWIAALTESRQGLAPVAVARLNTDQAWAPWKPFNAKALDAVQDCDELPCAVKLNEAEVAKMKQTPKDRRLDQYLELVRLRAQAYEKNGTRAPYEFPGGIADPWQLFEARGLKTDLALPAADASGELGMRIMDFKDSRIRPVRQLVDRRTAISQDRLQASVWVRDVYMDHYFDSWGEWGNVQCSPGENGLVLVTLAMTVELDMLKKNDFFSSLAKGSMRDAVRSLSSHYLDQWWDALFALAQEKTAAKAKKR